MHTLLNDRILWFDGDVTARTIDLLYNKLLNSEDISNIHVSEITPEIKMYNRYTDKPLTVKTENRALNVNWNIPEKYKTLPIKTFILQRLEQEIITNNFSDTEIDIRINRVNTELDLWINRGMIDLLRTLIYIVDVFTEKNIVWGTGRGSSCACYLLYLIKLHDVDSVMYNLDIKEFFR